MEFGVLGPVQVVSATRPVAIGGLRQRRLLAALLMAFPNAIDLDRLAEIVFDGDPPEAATSTLRTYVARLRKSLAEAEPTSEGFVVTRPGGYALAVDAASLDRVRFVDRTTAGKRDLEVGDVDAAIAALESALALWRGRPYDEIATSPEATAEVAGLERLQLEAESSLNDALLEAGAADEVVVRTERLIVDHPTSERFRHQQALALYRTQRQAEALRSIDAFTEEMIEIGLEPSADLRSLGQAIANHDPALVPAGSNARALRGYRLDAKIGASTDAVVWRAVQPGIGRNVALKTIASVVADDPTFIRRFDAEIQRVASFEHPHVVPIIDYWREPGAAHIVSRLYPTNLSSVLEAGPLDLDDVVRLVDQIGGALMAAHHADLVHGDLKPTNLLVNHADTYLADFGIAALLYSGSPRTSHSHDAAHDDAHRAPESRDNTTIGCAADQFGFAAVVAHALIGSPPFGVAGIAGPVDRPRSLHAQRAQIPRPVDAVLERALSWEPADRWPSMATFVAELTGALTGQDPADRSDVTPTNPYRGLRPFGEADHRLFFGREQMVSELVERVGGSDPSSRFVVLVGASGSGKSSVVRAGLVPEIRRGAVSGSQDWLVATMTPGPDPAAELAAAVRSVASLAADNTAARHPAELIAAAVPDGQTLLLVIDQLEEVFTQVADEAVRRRFFDGLVKVVSDERLPVHIVATLRADLFDRPLAYPGFGQLVKAGAVPLVAMGPAEMEAAITRPAAVEGLEVEPALVAELVAETSTRATALPMLQFALSQLFNRRSGRTVTLSSFRRLGGLGGAIAAEADELLDGLDTDDQMRVRLVLLRLVSVDEQRTVAKRRATRSELESVGGDRDAVGRIIDDFGAARLLAFDHEATTREPTVELAHEALITEWPRLAHWIAEATDALRVHAQVAAAAEVWSGHDEDPDDLLRGVRLDSALELAEAQPELLSDSQRCFIDASELAREGALVAERAEAERERRTSRRLRRLLAATAVFLAVALIGGGLAVAERRRANANTAEAELATLISRSAATSIDDPEVSVLLALEAHRRSPGTETSRAVLNALGSAQIPNRLSVVPGLETQPSCPTPTFITADGSSQTGVIDGRLLELDLATGVVTDQGEAPAECGVWERSATTDRVIVGHPSGEQIWVGTLDDPYAALVDQQGLGFLNGLSDPGFGVGVYVQPDDSGALVLRFFDSLTGADIGSFSALTDFASVVVDSSGSLIAVSYFAIDDADPGRIAILDADTAEVLLEIETGAGARGLAFDAANLQLLAGLDDGSLLTIDVVTGEIVAQAATSAETFITDIALRDDGLVVVFHDGVELVDRNTGPTGTGVQLQTAVGRLRPDGTIVTIDSANNFERFELDGSALIERSWPADPFAVVSFHEGRAGVVNSNEGEITAIELATGTQAEIELRNPDGSVFPATRWYPDGDDSGWALTASGVAARFENGERVEVVELPGRALTGTRMGDLWGVIGLDGSDNVVAHLVDLTPGDAEILFTVPVEGGFDGAHPTPDGGLHVFTFDDAVEAELSSTLLTYGPDGELVGSVDIDAVLGVINTVDPAAGLIAVAENFGQALIIDPKTGDVEFLPEDLAVVNLGFADDGELLVVTTSDGSIRIWDVGRAEFVALVWEGTAAGQSSPSWFDPDNDVIWVFTSGRLLEIPLDPDDWIDRACAIVPRPLTEEEWARFVPGDDAPQSACG